MEISLDAIVRHVVADAPDLAPLRRLLAHPGGAGDLASVLEGRPARGIGSWFPLRRAESGIGYDRLRLTEFARVLTGWWGRERHVLDGAQFWRHAAATAVVAAAAVDDPGRANEAFTAGFAHHLGRLALDRYAPDALDRALRVAESAGSDLLDAEREVLGFTEVEIAALAGSALRMPGWFVAAIGFPTASPPAEPFSFPGVVATACAATDVLGIPRRTPEGVPMTPATRAYAEGVIAVLRQFGGRSWVDRHVERVVAAALDGAPHRPGA